MCQKKMINITKIYTHNCAISRETIQPSVITSWIRPSELTANYYIQY
jgi:hypothetical protein